VVAVSGYITVPAEFVSTSKVKNASEITVLVTETDFVTIPLSTVLSITKSRTSPEIYLSYEPISSSSKSVAHSSSNFLLVPSTVLLVSLSIPRCLSNLYLLFAARLPPTSLYLTSYQATLLC
jgi:hypothetical protein